MPKNIGVGISTGFSQDTASLTPAPPDPALKLETSSYLLQETGDHILTEDN